MAQTTKLNSKWYYRLVKVVYIIVYLVSFALVFFFVILKERPFNDSFSSVHCDNGLVFSFKEKNLDANTSYTPWSQKTLKYICATDEQLGIATIEAFPVYAKWGNQYVGAQIRAKNDLGMLDKDMIASNLPSNYSTDLKQDSVFNNLGYAALWILGIVIVMEALRRIIYYISLGTLFP